MVKQFGGQYSRAGLFKIVNDLLAFAQPQLLRLLISFIDSYQSSPQPRLKGILIAFGMLGVSAVQSIFMNQYLQRTLETGMTIRSSMTALIYHKSLRLSNQSREEFPSGDIINRVAVDIERLQSLAQFGHQLWSAPLQIVLCLASLYQLLGLSTFAGLGVIVLFLPLNNIIVR